MHLSMNAPQTTKAAGAKTFYADNELWEAAKAYAEKNPRIKSLSCLIERLLVGELMKNGRKVGVKVPQQFLVR